MKEKVYKFIKEKSDIKDFFCDYFEIRNSLKMSDEELSIVIDQLEEENLIIRKDGEYIPKE